MLKLFDVAATERVILGSLYMFFTINYAFVSVQWMMIERELMS